LSWRGNELVGVGLAHLNPDDEPVVEIGDELAVVNRPGFRAHLLLREGWHDAEQVRRQHQGQGGPAGP
ncbi:MAG: dsRBD fold-containing protein, partial [Mycobacteriaceae bacterium]